MVTEKNQSQVCDKRRLKAVFGHIRVIKLCCRGQNRPLGYKFAHSSVNCSNQTSVGKKSSELREKFDFGYQDNSIFIALFVGNSVLSRFSPQNLK